MSLLIILIIITSAILYICTVYIILNWFCFKLCSVSFSFLKGVFVHVRSVSAHEEIYIECACINYSCSDLMKPLVYRPVHSDACALSAHYWRKTIRHLTSTSSSEKLPPQSLLAAMHIQTCSSIHMKFEQRDGCK